MNPNDYELVNKKYIAPEQARRSLGVLPTVVDYEDIRGYNSTEQFEKIDWNALHGDFFKTLLEKLIPFGGNWLYQSDERCSPHVGNPEIGEEQRDILFSAVEESMKELRLAGCDPVCFGLGAKQDEWRPLSELLDNLDEVCTCWANEYTVWALLRNGTYVKHTRMKDKRGTHGL